MGSFGSSATYDFDRPFVLLSSDANTSLSESGQSLVGIEGNGVVQFTGTFTTLRWKNPTYENQSEFTVGLRDPE